MLKTQKFKHVLVYLLEMVYDLALTPGDVVSMNLGFESELCVFSGEFDTNLHECAL